VLLAHAPDIFPAAAEAGLELVLVGHTHGGQIRLPFVGAVLAPGQGLLPHYDYGPFTEGGTTMIVNGGLGESLLPVRFNLRPEIVLVTLVAI
ncbi:MAG: metallophosphoesterase, partial [bacterium]